MATVQIRVPPGPVPADLEEAKASLEAAGHVVELIRDGDQEAQHDPFGGLDLDQVPPAMFNAMGITRAEVERHRNAPPALDHTGARPAPEAAVGG